MPVLTVVLFVLGLVLLIGGAELLVRGASRIAGIAGISPLVVGLTVVAFATSAPELAASFEEFQKYSVGPEPFAQWGTVEGQAAAQSARAYSGEISAEEAVANIEQVVQQEVFG